MTSDPVLIYGASGYTGRLLALGAHARGLRPLLGGRSRDRLQAVAEPLGLETRVARLEDAECLDAALRDVNVVLSAAGPFSTTWRPLVDACLRAGVHYLDISGELEVFEAVHRRDAEARRAGVMLMPGAGFEVVASDCLAAHVAARRPGARELALGVSGLAPPSRGSVKTLIENVGEPVKIRRGGVITSIAAGSLERTFDFGSGPRPSVAVGWGDVSSAFYTTGVPDIEVYYEATPAMRVMLTASRNLGWLLRTSPWQRFLKLHAEMIPEGPADAVRAAQQTVVVAEARDRAGRSAAARLRSAEGYGSTAAISPAIVERVLDGDFEVGFQTPGRVYGPDFVLSFPGVSREDLAGGGEPRSCEP
jgi:short subunit dehydrogenase-like uncharacterized protein